MSLTNHRTAIVVGASMAGLVTARVLSDHADRVIVLERDRLPRDAVPRGGVPQGRHAHALLSAGQDLLDGWFPGLSEDLRSQGAVPLDTREMTWHQAGDYRVRDDLGFIAMSMTRPLLETTVRRRLLADCGNVAIRSGSAVDAPLLDGDRVVGVRANGEDLHADLTVDCTGRQAKVLDMLVDAGLGGPEVSRIRIDMSYRTVVMRRRGDDLGASFAVAIQDPSDGHRIGTLLPVEGDQWVLTIGTFHGDDAPTDLVGFERLAHQLSAPEIPDVLRSAEVLSPVLSFGMPFSQRRHLERLTNPIRGFIALGDAICSFNPIYGQGMSSAALQAQCLGRLLDHHELSSAMLPRAFYRRAAKVIDAPWKIAACGDFADARTTGAKPAGTDLINRYLDRVLRACHTSSAVARQMMLVQNLLARSESLMRPTMLARVLLGSRRRRIVTPRDGSWPDAPALSAGGFGEWHTRALATRPAGVLS